MVSPVFGVAIGIIAHMVSASAVAATHSIHLVSKSGCEQYFGELQERMTIVDVSAPSPHDGFCVGTLCGPHNFVHYLGQGRCQVPSPPDGCHRYVKTVYTKECDFETGEIPIGFEQGDEKFTKDGVLKSCVDSVAQSETVCFKPPATDPQQCEC
mmetsp:Transcript_2718/g.7645  ORF Transcript_2718/g.7645 Transcript_2718/m.7645 type:complete len:154 (+) Transcript_2718:92-553(+)